MSKIYPTSIDAYKPSEMAKLVEVAGVAPLSQTADDQYLASQ